MYILLMYTFVLQVKELILRKDPNLLDSFLDVSTTYIYMYICASQLNCTFNVMFVDPFLYVVDYKPGPF